MVKLADTADLKSADPYQVVGVQVPLRAPMFFICKEYIQIAIASKPPY
jgi:hypothetical protein